jgi:Domain of unknown function (DUF4124)
MKRATHFVTLLHNIRAPAYNIHRKYWMPIMLTRLLWTSFPAMLAVTMVVLQPARADVYTWVDKSGSINVSNLAPPDGAQVTNVIHANPEEIAAREAALRERARQAEVQALAERVRQLESEVQFASAQPPPVQYRAAPQPPIIQYFADPTPPPAQYAPYAAPSTSYGCDPSQFDCGSWGFPGFYPASVIVLRAPPFRRPPPHRDMHRGAPNYAVHQPMSAPGTMHRG